MPAGLPLTKNVLPPLPKGFLARLGLIATVSATDASIQIKVEGPAWRHKYVQKAWKVW